VPLPDPQGGVVLEVEAIGGELAGGLQPVGDGDDGVPFWAGSLLALAGLSALALLRAAHRLRTPAERER
jgi:hypothetical protein